SERVSPRAALLDRSLFVRLSHQEGQDRPGWDLFRMIPDGSGKSRLTRDDVLEIDPVWSPDGQRIAFAGVTEPKELKSDIYVMNADGTRRRRLTAFDKETIAACPTWSPDGRHIAF